MSDTTTDLFTNFRFGLEWEPKLATVMLAHPWPDSAFSMGDPKETCKTCGRAPASRLHEPNGAPTPHHNFEPSPPFTEAQITAALDQWRRRMGDLPTAEALAAWKEIHAEKFDRLRRLLGMCAVVSRENIETLGCTGCALYGLTLGDIEFLRHGLAGSGVGLPCFVPPDRYCLAHETSGGLQDGQTQHHATLVDKVARPLTPGEAAHDKLVMAARKSEREHGTHSMLHGHTLPAGWTEDEGAPEQPSAATLLQNVDELRAEGGIDDIVAAARPPLFAWKCDDHAKPSWTCRHCVAQAIVEGELAPVLEVKGAFNQQDSTVESIIAAADAQNLDRVEVWARVATFTRKLARD